MFYESLLLLAVLAVLLILPHVLLGAFAHVIAAQIILQAHCFIVLLIYFLWFWSNGGQTLAMKTWRIRWFPVMARPCARRRPFCAISFAGPASFSAESVSSGPCSTVTTVSPRPLGGYATGDDLSVNQRLSTHQIMSPPPAGTTPMALPR
jgi:uncharacterized RDD family membrane protein YckC